ncbi:thioesterase domain-containing protein [Paenibacillus algorifonticola]|uniref:thioesterase II family protein n=1 Tax=Paenibacillus algorifonticola TaxID=684063 RepID=UPI003D286F0B
MNRINLFTIPYAGGSAAIYNRWKKELQPFINVIPIELAGKGTRFGEPPYLNIESAIDDIYERIVSETGSSPYAIFGHSMGGLLAFELAHKIQRRGFYKPEHVFLSGMSMPTSKRKKIYSALDDDHFIHELVLLGATPKEFAENKELIELFLPIIRSDFSLIENRLIPHEYPALTINVSILSGTADLTTDQADSVEWSKLCGRECSFYPINGGHFFIHSEEDSLLNIISRTFQFQSES